MRLLFPVVTLCRVLGVSSSGYYARIKRKLSIRARQETRLEVEMRAALRRTRNTYGSERLQSDLADNGLSVGLHSINCIRKRLGLRCIQKLRFKVTTDSNLSFPVADNILGQRFEATAHARSGLPTLLIFQQMRVGFILQVTKTCTPK